jgi:hypothetical protein
LNQWKRPFVGFRECQKHPQQNPLAFELEY